MLLALMALSSTMYGMERSGQEEAAQTKKELAKEFPIPQEHGYFYGCNCKQLMQKLGLYNPVVVGSLAVAYLECYIYVLGHIVFRQDGDCI